MLRVGGVISDPLANENENAECQTVSIADWHFQVAIVC